MDLVSDMLLVQSVVKDYIARVIQSVRLPAPSENHLLCKKCELRIFIELDHNESLLEKNNCKEMFQMVTH